MYEMISVFIFFSVFLLTLSLSGFFKKKVNSIDERTDKLLKISSLDQDSFNLEKRENLSDLSVFDKILRKIPFIPALQIWLKQCGVSFSPGLLILFSLVNGAVFFLVSAMFKASVIIEICLSAFAMTLPFLYLSYKRNMRMKLFGQAFPDSVARMVSSLRAGYSLQMALESVVENSQSIVSHEFRQVLARMEVGQAFESALKRMLEYIDIPDLRLFIASIIIQRESGGNLAELLENLEATIQERFALRRELEAATAQAKLSGMVLSFMPIFVGSIVYFIHKTYIMFFFTDPVGKNLLFLCIAGQIMGTLTIRKIVKIDM